MRIPQFLATLLVAANMASAQLVVSHMSASTASPTNQPKPYLKIENQGGTAVDLSKITLDYLISESGLQPTALVADCWYVSSGTCPDLTAEFASIPLQEDGTRKADVRIRIGFTRGSLAAGQELIIQWGYHEQAYQRQFDETDDWSFTQANGQWNVNTRVAVGSNGTSTTGTAMVWKGLVPGLPSTGKAGDVVHSQAQNASFVYDGTSWVLVSEIGKVGPQGPAGVAGDQGVQGPQGVAGPAGAPGAPGAAGAVGPKGDKGDAGSGDNAALLQMIADLTARVGRMEGGTTNPNEFIDNRDGQKYKTVTIGGKRWMAQSLNFGGEGKGWCYNNQETNCTKYGRLYDWATLMALPEGCNTTTCAEFVQATHKGICPEGWHVPTDAEWTALTTFVGQDNNFAWGGREGRALKATAGWYNGNGSDIFGFRALPGGFVDGGASSNADYLGYWWSATVNDATSAWSRYMHFSYNIVNRNSFYKSYGFSARCLED